MTDPVRLSSVHVEIGPRFGRTEGWIFTFLSAEERSTFLSTVKDNPMVQVVETSSECTDTVESALALVDAEIGRLKVAGWVND